MPFFEQQVPHWAMWRRHITSLTHVGPSPYHTRAQPGSVCHHPTPWNLAPAQQSIITWASKPNSKALNLNVNLQLFVCVSVQCDTHTHALGLMGNELNYVCLSPCVWPMYVNVSLGPRHDHVLVGHRSVLFVWLHHLIWSILRPGGTDIGVKERL